MSNELPVLSVVIPCYNDHEFINETVKSVSQQNYPNMEVIVVDDGSDKKTKNVLQLLSDNGVIHLITQNNKGQSTARNVGIEEAKGKYIFVLDSDDFLGDCFFVEAIKLLESNEGVKLVTCYANLIYCDDTTEIYKPVGGDLKQFLIKNCALGTSMFRKKDWQLVGKYDEKMRNGFEDWEFFIRLMNLGGKCEVLPIVGYNYRKREYSTTYKANKVKYELLKYIYLKHQVIYEENFELIINHLLSRIEREEVEKFKKRNSLEYKIGYILLKPLKYFKRLFK